MFDRKFVVWPFDVWFNGNHVFSGPNSAVKLTDEMIALAGQSPFHCKFFKLSVSSRKFDDVLMWKRWEILPGV